MFLIADSGSTKTQWALVEKGKNSRIWTTAGMNPFFLGKEDMKKALEQEFTDMEVSPEAVYFYGAGCAFPEKNEQVKEVLSSFFKTPQIEVQSDLMAAARALCHRSAGIVCILGTGSNSCYYNGEKIVKNVKPLGYILGDEGSGTYIGKKLLGDILKEIISPEIRELFFKEYAYTYTELMDRVYREPLPNRFLAGFTRFVARHLYYPELEEMVMGAMDEFIRRNILQYEYADSLPVSFTGSVAYVFRKQLECQLQKYGCFLGQLLQTPIEGLIEFHKAEQEPDSGILNKKAES